MNKTKTMNKAEIGSRIETRTAGTRTAGTKIRTRTRTAAARATATGTAALAALALACASGGARAAAIDPVEPVFQSYSIDIEAKILSDRKTRGVSDSFNNPGAELTIEAAHETGLLGYLQFGTVSTDVFPEGNGTALTGALGYRWGNPDAWHFGLALAQEWFPGARATGVPTGMDWATGEPTGLADTRFDTRYAVFEFGYGALRGRYLYVLSKDFRGNNTAVVCGSAYLPDVLAGGDPGKAMECYEGGFRRSGGSHLIDLDYTYPLGPRTHLKAHLGYQKVRNFRGLDGFDYSLGIVHTEWGLDFGLEVAGARLRNRDLAVVTSASGEKRRTDRTALVATIAKRF